MSSLQMDSGLRPIAKKCFWTNKYLTHGDKLCEHTWQPHRLDKTGGYILFPSLCWHKGFYHNKFNKTFIQAQLILAPLMGEDIGPLTRSFSGKDFIDGNLDKSIIAKLTHNVITRWMRVTLYWNSHHALNSKEGC